MVSLLIILYVLQANSMTVPTGCFIAAWIGFGFYVALAILKVICESIKP